ncbi:MAG: 2-amino-4-hydroxy-6-hydroxymethyldihydropteridine diphosphokinase [Planctomycetota bacterium]|nr:MAG: 2-amino-4-hydroxy-6-hydroxymethyldihydropteridine diphosphokinase [Planctomycetota bacterium]
MSAAERAWIGLGSNLGDRERLIERACERLAASPGIAKLRRSRVRETAPVGGPPGQPAYLNAVLQCQTVLEPEALLAVLQRIERELGRDRSREVRWGPRPIDLDLLLYGQRTVRAPTLTVPHPRLHVRRFVLEPLCELAPALVVPGTGRTVRELLAALEGAAPPPAAP